MSRESGGADPNRRELLKMIGVTPVFGYFSSVPSRTEGAVIRQALEPPYSLAERTISVALDGDTAVVGSPPSPMGDGSDVGSVTFFTREAGRWTRETTISGPGGGEQFGETVAIKRSTALVGSPLGALGDVGGRVTVLGRDGEEWRRKTILRRERATGVDQFGCAVALEEETAVVGASTATTERGFRTGCACVFTRMDERWREAAVLQPPSGVDGFGTAVALDGDTLVVGAHERHPGTTLTVRGVAFVFVRKGAQWRRTARLESEGYDDGFGTILALDSDILLVGAPTETNGRGTNAGAVHVFSRTSGLWSHRQTLRTGAADNQFGTAVALDDDIAVVASRANAAPVVFSRVAGRWLDVSNLDPGTGDHRLPTRTRTAVALDDTRVFVGISGSTDGDRPRDGTVTVFET